MVKYENKEDYLWCEGPDRAAAEITYHMNTSAHEVTTTYSTRFKREDDDINNNNTSNSNNNTPPAVPSFTGRLTFPSFTGRTITEPVWTSASGNNPDRTSGNPDRTSGEPASVHRTAFASYSDRTSGEPASVHQAAFASYPDRTSGEPTTSAHPASFVSYPRGNLTREQLIIRDYMAPDEQDPPASKRKRRIPVDGHNPPSSTSQSHSRHRHIAPSIPDPRFHKDPPESANQTQRDKRFDSDEEEVVIDLSID
jgi:hypothetical protein